MRLETLGQTITVVLSRRNLLSLAHKLDMPNSARTLVGGDVIVDGNAAAAPVLIVKVEDDDEHYRQRSAPPGEIHPDTEEFVADAEEAELAILQRVAALTLGLEGRMIAASKTRYQDEHPDHVAVFNANVCVGARKVWHGDFDATRDEPQLHELARLTGQVVSLLYERDGRFENEQEPLLTRAVLSVAPTGHTRFAHKWFERSRDGTLRRRAPRASRSD
jgi:hypothetical protein